jgi:hypothetical protein
MLVQQQQFSPAGSSVENSRLERKIFHLVGSLASYQWMKQGLSWFSGAKLESISYLG